MRESYGKIAVSEGSCRGATPNCCGSAPAAAETIAQQIGYSAAELAALPDGANGVLEDDKRGLQVFYRLALPCVKSFTDCLDAAHKGRAVEVRGCCG